MTRFLSVVVTQPSVPNYRVPFFDLLNDSLSGRFQVFSGCTPPDGLSQDQPREWQKSIGDVVELPGGLEWQPGLHSISLDEVEVLVVCGAPRNLSTLLLLLRARFRGVKTIWWGHLWSSSSKTWRYWIRRILFNLADGLVFYTDAEVEAYNTNRKRQSKQTVSALNNGLDHRTIQDHRSEYRARARPRSILFIGRLTKKSGLELLLMALASTSLQDIKLEVVGSGADEHRFRSIARDLGVESKVTWHGAISKEQSIAKIANRCRVFCYPGEVGLSIIHAMNYGLPVVVHSNKRLHMPEIAAFRDEVTGWSFVHGSSTDLSHTLARIIDDFDELDSASRSALFLTRDTFHCEDMARRMIKAIVSVYER